MSSFFAATGAFHLIGCSRRAEISSGDLSRAMLGEGVLLLAERPADFNLERHDAPLE